MNLTTIKVFESTRTDLRIIAAFTGETQQDAAKRIIEAERKRLESGKKI